MPGCPGACLRLGAQKRAAQDSGSRCPALDQGGDDGIGLGDSVDVYAAGLTAGTPSVCGNGTVEPGEACDGSALGARTCCDFNCSGGTLACKTDCSGFDTSGCLGCVTCNGNGICEAGEDCGNCASDCPSGTTPGAVCGNGVCEAGNGEDCLTCPADCNGQQGGKPSGRFCCGNGSCSNPGCTTGGFACTDKPVAPDDYSYERHVRWMSEWLLAMELENITFFGQDWGGLIGLRLVVIGDGHCTSLAEKGLI